MKSFNICKKEDTCEAKSTKCLQNLMEVRHHS